MLRPTTPLELSILLDRIDRDEPTATREEARAHGKRIRDVGCGAVHRALDAPNGAARHVRDEVADRPAKVEDGGRFAHSLEPTPAPSAFFASSVRSL